MKNIKVKTKYLIIPIFLIFILSLGIVSASSIEADDSSAIDAIISEDSNDIIVTDSIEIEDVSSSNGLNDESDLGDSTEKTFADLQEEIDNANDNATLELSGTYSGSEEIIVNKSLNFIGKGDKAIIKSDNYGDIFNFITPDHFKTVKFENIRFVSNSTNLKSWISSDGDFISFENCIFENIAIVLDFSDGYVNNCQFIDSSMGFDHTWGNISYSDFTNSSISISQMATANIYNCNFENVNRTAIWTYDADVDIINCTFKNCSADNGGAILADGVNKIISCVFINNIATGYGGAIYVTVWQYDFSIENCSFINNSAKFGGAIAWNTSNMANISNCIFDNNNPLASTLYFIEDINSTSDFSKLNITANNNFWAKNDIALRDIFKSKNGETFKLANVLTLKLKSNGNNSYTLYFANSAGNQVSKMPDYSVTLKDRRDGSVIAKDLLLVNGKASFKYGKTLNMDVIDIINQGGKSVTKLSTSLSRAKLITYYLSGRTFNVKVLDKYSKKALSGIKLTLKVFTGKKYKYYYVTTNAKGIAAFKASSLAIGTHKVEVTSSDKNYLISKISSSIKINKARTIVSAPKVSVKYKRNNYFKVTVKHYSTKKYIKGLKLKLRIYTGKKFKNYYVKTNSKGLAKFNTKGLKKGTHKVAILSANGKFIVSKTSSIRVK